MLHARRDANCVLELRFCEAQGDGDNGKGSYGGDGGGGDSGDGSGGGDGGGSRGGDKNGAGRLPRLFFRTTRTIAPWEPLTCRFAPWCAYATCRL